MFQKPCTSDMNHIRFGGGSKTTLFRTTGLAVRGLSGMKSSGVFSTDTHESPVELELGGLNEGDRGDNGIF